MTPSGLLKHYMGLREARIVARALPSLLDQNPLSDREINGMLVELRDMPREVREIAFAGVILEGMNERRARADRR